MLLIRAWNQTTTGLPILYKAACRMAWCNRRLEMLIVACCPVLEAPAGPLLCKLLPIELVFHQDPTRWSAAWD